MTERKPFNEVFNTSYGFQKKLAKLLGKTEVTISAWKKKGVPVKAIAKFPELPEGVLK